jgi:hypothetical protein
MGRAASPRRVHSGRWCSVEKMVMAGRAEVVVSPRTIAAEESRERIGSAVSAKEVQRDVVEVTVRSENETGVLRKTRGSRRSRESEISWSFGL